MIFCYFRRNGKKFICLSIAAIAALREADLSAEAIQKKAVSATFILLGMFTIAFGSPQVREQNELCAKDATFPLGKSFLEDFGIKTDNFEKSPKDIQCFVENAATCEHFAGEEPYDKERAKEIIKALKQYCSVAQSMLKTLKNRYKDKDAVRILAVCEQGSDAVCASFEPSPK